MTLRRPSGGLLIILASILLIFSLNLNFRTTATTQLSPHLLTSSLLDKTIPIPFGHQNYIHHHTNPASVPAPAPAPKLLPKPKRDDEATHYYDEAVCKGEQALNKIKNQAPTDRTFTRQDQVDAWEVIESRGGVPADMYPALQELDIPYDADSVKGVFASQNKGFKTSDGEMHPKTSGSYTNLFIPDTRTSTIIALNNHSPSAYALPGSPLPSLHRWSDVIWQNWTSICTATSTPPSALRYIIHRDIFTTSTRRIMEYIEVVGKDGLDLPWPGNVYGMDSEDGKALLGSVHGLGVAWLVVDHSGVLGRREGLKVRIWTAVSRPAPTRKTPRPVGKVVYLLGFELVGGAV
ncbi:MAG: hypothetical protein Q9169_003005 [Polycauliona sp. 2 TL-2023]